MLLLKSGNILAQSSTPASDLREERPVTLDFDYNPLDFPEPSPIIPESKPLFVYGRLLEKLGRKNLEDIQIIFEASRNNDSPIEPIATVRTEANGYFFIEYPEGNFSYAAARIGLDIIENPIPIRLDRVISDGEQSALVFPRHVILVAELGNIAEIPEKECGCQEIDMQDNKRILEEYSFFSLIRTTEPEIRGFILEEDDEITLGEVLNKHPIKIWEIIDPILKLPAFSHLAIRGGFTPSEISISRANPGTSTPAPSNEMAEALKKLKSAETCSTIFSRTRTV